jgi:hypothetical protein
MAVGRTSRHLLTFIAMGQDYRALATYSMVPSVGAAQMMPFPPGAGAMQASSTNLVTPGVFSFQS